MTANENIQLERIEVKIDTLNNFMATYTEKSVHCTAKFKELEDTKKDINIKIDNVVAAANWNKWKIVFFSGGFAVIWAILLIIISNIFELELIK